LTALDDYCWPLGTEVPDTSIGNQVEEYFEYTNIIAYFHFHYIIL
jgi:hypothetical protein